MIGSRLGPYAISAKLGEGGMGEIFRATDTRLGREVAVKVLPTEVASDPDRLRRFEQEARAASALNHPGILTVHDFGSEDGVCYLVTELLEGESLRELLSHGVLPEREAIRLGADIARSLAAAHAKGIVHRDLKPENLFLTSDGRIKILDFGLARRVAPVGPSSGPADATTVADLTEAGAVLGTVGYMAPEQARGLPVDARADLFALGCVLYEMLTGRRAFDGSSAIDTLAAILHEDPLADPEGGRSLPEGAVRLLRHCLEKEPGRRFPSASDVAFALDGLREEMGSIDTGGPLSRAHPGERAPELAAEPAGPRASAEEKSIVVLPFANLSPDSDAEYFSDGLTDEVITDLSRIRALRVISRSSAMRLKGDPRGLEAIVHDLGCRYVLEGSVRRAANQLRITARLVDAPNDAQLWADKYSGTLDDVFDIQERVSRAIVDALEIRLSAQEAARLAERPIEDIHAHESYLRARTEIWSFLPDGLSRAISRLEAALDLVGDNALLYQGLGEAYFQYVNVGAAIGREAELFAKAERCAEKIFALEPGSPRGHLVRAPVELGRGDIHGCARSLRRVLRASPNEVVALQLYGHVLGWLGGRPDAAAPLAARLLEIDPLNPMSLMVNAMVPLFAGRFSEAVEPARRMFELDPLTPVWRGNYVMALSYAGRLDEAEALTEGLAAEPDADVGTWWMGLSRAAWRRDRAEVSRLAGGPYRQVAAWDAEIPWALASAHAAVGANDEALLWLDRAITQGMINFPFLAEHDRYLVELRSDSRLRDVLARAESEWERFAF